jgi:hypothetical protein
VNPAVAGLRQQQPCHPIDKATHAAQHAGNNKRTADQQRINAQAVGNPGSHTTKPAVIGAPNTEPPDR